MGFFNFLLISLFTCASSEMDIKKSRCTIQESLAIGKSAQHQIYIKEDLRVVAALKNNLEAMSSLEEQDGELRATGTFCGDAQSFQLKARPFKHDDIKQLPEQIGSDVAILDLFYIRAEVTHTDYCVEGDRILQKAECVTRVRQIALGYNKTPPQFPATSSKSHFEYVKDQLKMKSYPLGVSRDEVSFITSDGVFCGEDISHGVITSLQKQIFQELAGSTEQILDFIKPLLAIQKVENQEFYSNDSSFVLYWKDFKKHDKQLFKLLSEQQFFPTFSFSLSGQNSIEPELMTNYLNYMSFVTKCQKLELLSREKRSILDYIFGQDSQEMSKLRTNQNLISDAFKRLSNNAKILKKSQHQAALVNNKIQINERDLMAAVKLIGIKTLQTSLSASKMFAEINKGRRIAHVIEHLELILSESKRQAMSLIDHLNQIILMKTGDCKYSGRGVICLVSAPALQISNENKEVYAVFRATEGKFRKSFNFQCLPHFINETAVLFIAHGKTFTRDQSYGKEEYISQDGSRFESYCLDASVETCSGLYSSQVSSQQRFEECYYVHGAKEISLNCQKPKVLKSRNDKKYIFAQVPLAVKISELPLLTEQGAMLTLSHLEQTITDSIPSLSLSSFIPDDVRSAQNNYEMMRTKPLMKTKTPEKTHLQRIFLPTKFEAEHGMGIGGIMMILSLLALVCMCMKRFSCTGKFCAVTVENIMKICCCCIGKVRKEETRPSCPEPENELTPIIKEGDFLNEIRLKQYIDRQLCGLQTRMQGMADTGGANAGMSGPVSRTAGTAGPAGLQTADINSISADGGSISYRQATGAVTVRPASAQRK